MSDSAERGSPKEPNTWARTQTRETPGWKCPLRLLPHGDPPPPRPQPCGWPSPRGGTGPEGTSRMDGRHPMTARRLPPRQTRAKTPARSMSELPIEDRLVGEALGTRELRATRGRVRTKPVAGLGPLNRHWLHLTHSPLLGPQASASLVTPGAAAPARVPRADTSPDSGAGGLFSGH